MISSINTGLSASSIASLFGPLKSAPEDSVTPLSGLKSAPTGYTDDILKTGDAIGNIIAIVAGMKEKEDSASQVFTMDGATRIDSADGGYTLSKTGTGLGEVAPRDPYGLKGAEQRAAGSGPEAASAQAYIKAIKSGSIEQVDMGQYGVSSIMTVWERYDADGTHVGGGGSTNIIGMDEFYKNYVDMSSGAAIFKPTGQYMGIGQNGTVMTLSLWGEKANPAAA